MHKISSHIWASGHFMWNCHRIFGSTLFSYANGTAMCLHYILIMQCEVTLQTIIVKVLYLYLYSQVEVLLNKLIIVFGPIADSVVYFEHTGVSWYWERRPASLQLGPKGPPVHPLPKMGLFSDDADRMVLSKVLVRQKIIFEQKPRELYIFFFILHI